MAFGALSSGISALRSFSKGMEVIGNNIANVNTVSFKGSRIKYSETFNQVLRQSAPSSDSGGSNVPASQVGLGVQVEGITGIFEQGGLSATSQPTDLAISGEGFFLVKDTRGSGGGEFATRGGDFRIDDQGFLVTSEGFKVQGEFDGSLGFIVEVSGDGSWSFKPDDNALSGTIKPTQIGNIQLDYNKGAATVVNENFDPATSRKRNAVEYTNHLVTRDAEGDPEFGPYTTAGYSHRVGGYTTDGAGNIDGVTGWHAFAEETVNLLVSLKNKANNPDVISLSQIQEAVSSDFYHKIFSTDLAAASSPIDGSAINDLFTTNGLTWPNNIVEADEISAAIGIMPTDTESALAVVAQVRADNTPDLARFSVEGDGTINYFLDNGDSFARGRIGLVDFNDKTALIREGRNLYSGFGAAGNKGESTTNPTGILRAGEAGMGSIQQGALELSNVDLTNEFAQMITTQRGFQAGSRIITVSDDILQEVVNLKR